MPERAPQQLSEPRLLDPFSTCGSCVETLDGLGWEASSTFHVGQWALGVRSSSVEMDDALRRVLVAHVVDIDAPSNFSALMADDDQARSFNFLYRSSDPLVRTRAPGRLLRALLQYLSDFAEPTPGTVRLQATGFVMGGRAIVAPDALRSEIGSIETRINVAGLQVIDAPVLHLEQESGCLVVPEPALTVDADALADFERRHPPPRREPAPVLPGRYPIGAWAFTTDQDRVGPLAAAQAVAAAAQEVVGADDFGAQRILDLMALVVAQTPVYGMWWREPAELASQLCGLAKGSST